MKANRSLLLAGALCAFATPVFADVPEFDNFYLFGDSLSDIGNAPDAAFTNSHGPLAAQFFANQMGISIFPSNYGGTDYAIGGDESGIFPPPGVSLSDGGMTAQVSHYLSNVNGKADPNALYSLWAGANDISDNFGLLPSSSLITDSISNIITATSQIHNAGGRYIMVMNLPDLGRTPLVIAEGQNPFIHFFDPDFVSQFSQLSEAYNLTLNSQLNSIGFRVIQPDVMGLFNFIQANYASFGFTSPLGSVCTIGLNQAGCKPNPNAYMFYDGYHPSVATGQIGGDYLYSIFQGSLDAGILAVAPFAVIDSQNANVNAELLDIRSGIESIPVGQWKSFYAGTYNPNGVDSDGSSRLGYSATSKDVTIGLDYQLNCYTVLGVAVGRDLDPVDFNSNGGGFYLNENMVTGFGGFQDGPVYATGELNFGVPEFHDFNRNFNLGIMPLNVYGNTQGTQYGIAGSVGYNVIDTAIKTGPYVSVDYQLIHVNGFDESGVGNFADMQYDEQSNQTLTPGIGWQIIYCTSIGGVQIQPYAQATFNHEYMNGNRTIDANPVSANGGIGAFPFTNPNGDFVTVGGGIAGTFAHNIMLNVGYNATVDQSEENSHAVTLAISVPMA